MSGCAPLPPAWSVNRVVNREDGAVVVWRLAEYAGGRFNGFDTDAVAIDRARYVAARIDGAGPAIPLRVDYMYRRGEGTPDPVFAVDRDGTVFACVHARGCTVNDVLGVWQLGTRGEPLRLQGTQLLLDDACRVDLAPALPHASAAELKAAYFPRAQVLYVVAGVDGVPALYLSQRCGALQPVDAQALTAFAADAARRHVDVRDVVPGIDPERPALLLAWMEQHDGVFGERTGVLQLGSGRAHPLDRAWEHPLGFWRSSPNEVLAAYDDADGTAVLTIVDAEQGTTRTVEQVRVE